MPRFHHQFPISMLKGIVVDLEQDAAEYTADADVNRTLCSYLLRITRIVNMFGGGAAPAGQFTPQRKALVERLHSLGPRVLAEFLAELEREYGCGNIDERLGRFSTIDPVALEFLGGTEWPAMPVLREVK